MSRVWSAGKLGVRRNRQLSVVSYPSQLFHFEIRDPTSDLWVLLTSDISGYSVLCLFDLKQSAPQ